MARSTADGFCVSRKIVPTGNMLANFAIGDSMTGEKTAMPTMNVSLTPEMAEFVEKELATGDYATASELVRDALRVLRRDRDLESEKTEILRQAIDHALVQALQGQFSQRGVMEIAESVLKESKA
jgi:antitoxin ParD1/3/4